MNPVYAGRPELLGNSRFDQFRDYSTSGMVPLDQVHHAHYIHQIIKASKVLHSYYGKNYIQLVTYNNGNK